MKIKAWKFSKQLVDNAKGKIVIEKEEDWTQSESQKHEINKIRTIWFSQAPGSGAPSSLISGAIQATENMGMDVTDAEEYFQKGKIAHENNDDANLMKYTAKIFQSLNNANKNENHDYWNYKEYTCFDEFKNQSNFPNVKGVDPKVLDEQIYWGWMGQICAGSYGTALEGYSRETIKRDFENINDYLKPPSAYNDDITFEIAFLLAKNEYGKDLDSRKIAENWVSLIPYAWSAEDIALKNLLLGILPPLSGKMNNPYREWIGAQMRGSICGMVSPGNPLEAARLAWMDGEISHYNNGIIGEVFNAVMTSLAFVETDIRKILKDTIDMLPYDSEYRRVVKFAFDICENVNDAEEAFIICEKEFRRYNLVHSYPNAAIEVISMYFGEGDYNKTIYLVGLAGLDVDCNAGQVGNILGVLNYKNGLDKKWTKPMGTKFKTYVRNHETITIDELVKLTKDGIKS